MSATPPETEITAVDPQTAIDITQQAVLTGLMVGAPILITGLVTGLLIGLLQALTQIQEQTVAFVPKIVMMIVALSLSLSWSIMQMVEFSRNLLTSIPDNL